MTAIRDLEGRALPVHKCEPRSPRATAFATVFTQPDGGPPMIWHHQIFVSTDERDPAAQPVAITFCPFCGVRLEREHFT